MALVIPCVMLLVLSAQLPPLSAKPLPRISTTAAALEMKSVSVNATGAVLQQGNHVTQTGEVAKSEKAFEETASRSGARA